MVIRRKRDRQSADRAEVPLRPLVPLTVQLLVLELCRALLAHLLVQLAVGPLAVHAAVLDEAACRAVLELDASLAATAAFAAVGAKVGWAAVDCDAAHAGVGRSLVPPRPRSTSTYGISTSKAWRIGPLRSSRPRWEYLEEGLAVEEAGPWPWKRTSRVNLSFGFGNVILSPWKQSLGRGKGLEGRAASRFQERYGISTSKAWRIWPSTIVTSAVEEGLAVEAGPWPWKRTSRVNLAFGFGNVILSPWKLRPGRGKGLGGQPADNTIHHQAGGRKKYSRFNFLCSRPLTLRRQQQEEERINAGPEVSTFPDAGPEVSTFPDAGPERPVDLISDALAHSSGTEPRCGINAATDAPGASSRAVQPEFDHNATDGHTQQMDGRHATNVGHATDGHVAEGHATNGHTTDGHVAEGHTTNGHATDGHAAEGHAKDGHATDGHSTDGHATDGHAAAVQTPTVHAVLARAAASNNNIVDKLFVRRERNAYEQIISDCRANLAYFVCR
ncbi:hypothetical protein THAOC_11910, partial [Thalassiosira oceanica]